jgi:hypothetical protein
MVYTGHEGGAGDHFGEDMRACQARLRAERARLSERARACTWGDLADGAPLIGEVSACAIAQAALESMTLWLDDDTPMQHAAHGARLYALVRLGAQAGEAARSLIEGYRRSIAELHPEAVLEAEELAEESPPNEDAQREATVARMDGAELDAALAEPTDWPSGALAERLAALGRISEVQPFVERWAGGWYSAEAYLRAAAFAPSELAPLARDAMGTLDAPKKGDLCGRYPVSAVRALGPDEVLQLADGAGDETGQYTRMVALARVASALPEPQRSEAAARALRAYRQDPDFDALEELLKCAPWMPADEAAALLVDNLGQRVTPCSLETVFAGFAGIASFAPLIARAAGDPGLLAAADAVIAAEAWAR